VLRKGAGRSFCAGIDLKPDVRDRIVGRSPAELDLRLVQVGPSWAKWMTLTARRFALRVTATDSQCSSDDWFERKFSTTRMVEKHHVNVLRFRRCERAFFR